MDHSGDQTTDTVPVEATAPDASAAPETPDTSETSDASRVRRDSWGGDVINVVRGICMGAADAVPGVSGGTVALILGHYRRLVTSISRMDGALLGLVMKREFVAAAQRIDLRFLIALGIGILGGIAMLSHVMDWLLDHRLCETYAVFLGLMVASVWLVKDYVVEWNVRTICMLGFGIAAAVGISLMPPSAGSLSLPFLFISASLAICAMILPGISGAFVLLLLGVYHPVTGLVKDAVRFDLTFESTTQIAVFGSGCVIGLLAFSRLLKWMLDHHQASTMAVLMGLMIGSLAKLWPLQAPTPETANLEPKLRVMQYISPGNYPGSLAWVCTLVVLALAVVLLLERVANLEKKVDEPK